MSSKRTRRFIPFVIASFAALLLASCAGGPTVIHETGPKTPENQVKILVMIVPHGRHVKIFTDSQFMVVSNDSARRPLTEEIYTIPSSGEIVAIPGGFKIGRLRIIGESCRLVPLTQNPIYVYEIEPRRYFGELIIYRNDIDDTVDVVNEVGLEDYLIGVLGREVGADWPIEALKAQAVVSRTRVLFQRDFARRENERFDVRSDTKDQVYGGVPASTADGDPVSRAVKATAGQVLTFHGAIFKNYFSSTCGGATETVDRVFREDPALSPNGAIPCEYCKSSPVHDWRHRISLAEVVRRIHLARPDNKFDTITDFRPSGLDAAGHALAVEVVTDKGSIIFDNSNKFRNNVLGRSVQTEFWMDGAWHIAKSVDPKHREIIMSTSFQAKIVGDFVEFTGKGWGHAVGLCQFGAKTMAERGDSYDNIIYYYHPGTKIESNYNNQIP